MGRFIKKIIGLGTYMRNKRMFSLQIVDTDAFLDMPHSSQLLYFHLSMRADDDGFVSNPKKIMRTIGSQEDDYKVLLAKRFIIPFESGVCVIKHWRINNYIRSDRYVETVYEDEKKQLTLKENGSYTEGGEPVGIPDVNRSGTENRIEEKSIEENTSIFKAFWSAYPKKKNKGQAEKAFSKLNITEDILKLILEDIKKKQRSREWQKDDGQFIPYPATYLNARAWEDEDSSSKSKFFST